MLKETRNIAVVFVILAVAVVIVNVTVNAVVFVVVVSRLHVTQELAM